MVTQTSNSLQIKLTMCPGTSRCHQNLNSGCPLSCHLLVKTESAPAATRSGARAHTHTHSQSVLNQPRFFRRSFHARHISPVHSKQYPIPFSFPASDTHSPQSSTSARATQKKKKLKRLPPSSRRQPSNDTQRYNHRSHLEKSTRIVTSNTTLLFLSLMRNFLLPSTI